MLVGLAASMEVLRGHVESLILHHESIEKNKHKLYVTNKAKSIIDSIDEVTHENIETIVKTYNTNATAANYLSEECYHRRFRLNVLETGSGSNRTISPVNNLSVSILLKYCDTSLRKIDQRAHKFMAFDREFIRLFCIRDALLKLADQYMQYNTTMVLFYEAKEIADHLNCGAFPLPKLVSLYEQDSLIPPRYKWTPVEIPKNGSTKHTRMSRKLSSSINLIPTRIKMLDKYIKDEENRSDPIKHATRDLANQLKNMWEMVIGDGEWMQELFLRGVVRDHFVNIEDCILKPLKVIEDLNLL